MVLPCLLAVLAGCSPAGDADMSSERPQNELTAYGKAFRASGAQFWIDHPEQVLDRPDTHTRKKWREVDEG